VVYGVEGKFRFPMHQNRSNTAVAFTPTIVNGGL